MTRRKETGLAAEAAVAAWLEGRGYRIVDRNVRVGRLEVDLIAERPGLLVVCEVRSRRGSLVDPSHTFDPAKRQRVLRAALQYWLNHGAGRALRVDAAAVSFDGPRPVVRYYEDAFADAASF